MTRPVIYQIPFDKYGLVSYVDEFTERLNKDFHWKDNYNFYDELQYFDYRKGRSSVQFYFRSLLNKQEYPMFISDFHKVLLNKQLKNNIITGNFTFHKKGCNYGIYVL